MWQHGHFYWNELMTRDPEGAKAFYGTTVGWQFEGMAMPDGTYWVCKDGDRPVGGIMDMNRPGFDGKPAQWFAYVAVDDVDARVKRAEAAGAELMRPSIDVPGVGRIAILKDPTGAELGWMTPAPEQLRQLPGRPPITIASEASAMSRPADTSLHACLGRKAPGVVT